MIFAFFLFVVFPILAIWALFLVVRRTLRSRRAVT